MKYSRIIHFDFNSGVCHADDLIYLWDPVVQFGDEPILGPLTNDDALMRDILTSSFSNFAIFGNPTPLGSEMFWTPVVTETYQQYWNISGPEPIMATNAEIQERMTLWDEIMG